MLLTLNLGLGLDRQWKREGTGSHEGWVEEILCLRKSKLSYKPQEEWASPRAHHWILLWARQSIGSLSVYNFVILSNMQGFGLTSVLGSASFFCEVPESKYFSFCRPHGLFLQVLDFTVITQKHSYILSMNGCICVLIKIYCRAPNSKFYNFT